MGVFQHVKARPEKAQCRIFRRLGQAGVQKGARLVKLARLDLQLHHARHGGDIAGIGPGQVLQIGDGVIHPVLQHQGFGLDQAGGLQGPVLAKALQGRGDGGGTAQIPLAQPDLGEAGQEVHIARRQAQGIAQHVGGGIHAPVLHEEPCVKERLRRGPPRGLDCAGIAVAGQWAGAVAVLRIAHQHQNLGVARRLGQGAAKCRDGLGRPVCLDQPIGLEFQRRNMGRVRRQHLVKARKGPRDIAGRSQHPCQRDLEIKKFRRLWRRVSNKGGHCGQPFGGLAKIEIQGRRPGKIGQGDGVGGDQAAKFRAPDLGTPRLQEKLDQRHSGCHTGLGGCRQTAQKRLCTRQIAAIDVPGDHHLAGLFILWKGCEEGLDRGTEARSVIPLGQEAQPHEVKAALGRQGGQCGLHLGLEACRVIRTRSLVDQHLTRDQVGGIALQRRAGHPGGNGGGGGIARNDGAAIVQGSGEKSGIGVFSRQPLQRQNVAFRLGPVADQDRELGQRMARLDGVGGGLHDPLILCVSLPQIAVFTVQAGIGKARLGM